MSLCNSGPSSSLLLSRLATLFALVLSVTVPSCDKGGDDDKKTDDDDDADDETTSSGDDDDDEAEIPDHFKGQTNPLDAEDAEVLISGEDLYLEHCSLCHGDEGEGMKDSGESLVSAEVKGWGDDRLLWIISDGIEGTVMQSFSEAMSEDERWMVIAYIRSLAK